MKSVQRTTPGPKSVAARIAETFATTVFLMVLSFSASVATARLLGPTGRGYINMLATWLPVIGTVASCGMGRTFVFYSKVDPQQFASYRARLFLVVGIAVVPIALLSGLGSPVLYPNLPATELQAFQWITGLSVPLYALGFALTQAAQYRSDMRVYNLSRIAQPLLLFFGLMAAVAFGYADYRVFAAIATAAIGLGAVIVGVALFRHTSRKEPSISTPLPPRGSYAKYAAGSYITDVMGVLSANLDKIFIIVFLPAKEMGIYAVAFGLSRIVGQIQGAVGETVFSMNIGFSIAEVSARVAKVFRQSLLVSFTCGIVAIIVVPPAIPTIFGRGFDPAGPIFAILVVEAILTGASGVLGQIFNIIGRPHLVLVRLLLSTLVGAVFMLLVVRTFGAIGVAAATVLAALIRLFASLLIYRSATQLSVLEFIPTSKDVQAVLSEIHRKLGRIGQ
jgi:O-antigen/teichoic acid export membrane protein